MLHFTLETGKVKLWALNKISGQLEPIIANATIIKRLYKCRAVKIQILVSVVFHK